MSDSTVIYRDGSDWYITLTNSSIKYKFIQDKPKGSVLRDNVEQKAAARPLFENAVPPPQSLMDFANNISLGPDLLTDFVLQNQIIAFEGGAAPPNWIANTLFEGADEVLVGESTVVTAADLGSFDDILAALADEIAALDVAEDVVLALGALGVVTSMKARRRNKLQLDIVIASGKAPSFTRLFDKSDSFTIVFINETLKDWTLDSVLDPTDPGGLWKVTQSPPQSLSGSNISSGTLSMFQNMVFLGLGPQTLNVVYKSPEGDVVGGQIVIPVQVWHLGHSPYCQIKYPGKENWNWPGPDSTSAQDIAFPQRYKMHVEASGDGTSFSLKMRVSKL